MQRVLIIQCVIRKVSLLFSAIYAKCPYYLVLYMQRVLIVPDTRPGVRSPEARAHAWNSIRTHGQNVCTSFSYLYPLIPDLGIDTSPVYMIAHCDYHTHGPAKLTTMARLLPWQRVFPDPQERLEACVCSRQQPLDSPGPSPGLALSRGRSA